MNLIVWRDSVCMADDVDAPHELVVPLDGEPLREVVVRLIGRSYLATIAGGRATWILYSGARLDRALAVVAQQWCKPQFLVDPEAAAAGYIEAGAIPHLRFDYWCQVDPRQVFGCLHRGEPLPDKYGRDRHG